jgi:hypothetical protein
MNPSDMLPAPPQTGDEGTFLGLGATAWTALATIVALSIAVVGALWKSIGAWLRKPRLSLQFQHLPPHSEDIQDKFWQLRLPIRNRKHVNAATNVEIFLARIDKEYVTYAFTLPAYLPIRLHWSHAGGPLCERIPPGTYRLVDFGKIWFNINPKTGFVEAVAAELKQASGVSLGFDTEIPSVNQELRLPAGSYVLELIVAAERVTKRCRVRVTIKNELFRVDTTLSDYFEAELI